jgi:siroheme synthase-like protein
MSAFGFPVNLELRGRRCLVIGAHAVRDGKVEGLVAGGADDVLVLAEAPSSRLDDLSRVDGVRVVRRRWRATDLDGAFLVIAHDRDPNERDAIAREARSRHVLVNMIDDIPNCDWAAPATVRRGELLLAIGTGGASPALARRVRERLEAEFGPEWGEVVRVLREVRAETLPAVPDLAKRAERWRAALDPDEAAGLVREGRSDELRARLRDRVLGEVPAS